MISNYKKQEYLEQIDILLLAIELGRASGENLEKYLEEIVTLKQEVESQTDITLEETMSSKPSLSLEGNLETAIEVKIDDIGSKIPKKYMNLATFEKRQDENIPQWLKIAFVEHPNWKAKCIEILAEEPDNIDYARLVDSNYQLFEFLPLEEKEKNPELCKRIIAKDLEMLKYVPINVIRGKAHDWIGPFFEKGIDIKLFLKYDKDIRAKAETEFVQRRSTIEEVIDSKTKNKEDISIEVKERFPRTFGISTQKVPKYTKKPEDLTEEEIKRIMEGLENGSYYGMNLIPLDAFRQNQDWYRNLCQKNNIHFKSLPAQIKIEDAEWTMEFVNNHAQWFDCVPDEIKIDNPAWCMKLVSSNPEEIGSVPTQVIADNLDWCKRLVGRSNSSQSSDWTYSKIPNSVKITDIVWLQKVLMQNLGEYSIPMQIRLAKPNLSRIIDARADKEKGKVYSWERTDSDMLYSHNLKEYQETFYGPELNIAAMQEQYSAVAIQEIGKRAVISQDRDPIFDEIYLAISRTNKRLQGRYLEKACDISREYERLMENISTVSPKKMSDMISRVSLFEMEIKSVTHQLSERQEAEQAYQEMRLKMEKKILQIEGVNPEIAKKYREELKQNEEQDIMHRMKTGMPSKQELASTMKVDFYINANLPKEEMADESSEPKKSMVVYAEQKKKGFLGRLLDKIRGIADSHNVPHIIEPTKKDELDAEYREPEEFADMSLEDLQQQLAVLEMEIREKRFDRYRSEQQHENIE